MKMMKKIIGLVLVAFLFIALPWGAARTMDQTDVGMNQQDMPMGTPSEKVRGSANASSQETPFGEQNIPSHIMELRERMREQRAEMMGNASSQGSMVQNQNKVRMAVHSLLLMEDYVGGLGQDVREVARDMNQSMGRMQIAQERIQNRSAFARFLIGGNDEAAEELSEVANQTRQRVQKLKQIRDECDCPDEVKVMFEEQIQQLEKEQQNMQEIAQEEQRRNGLFGWLI